MAVDEPLVVGSMGAASVLAVEGEAEPVVNDPGACPLDESDLAPLMLRLEAPSVIASSGTCPLAAGC